MVVEIVQGIKNSKYFFKLLFLASLVVSTALHAQNEPPAKSDNAVKTEPTNNPTSPETDLTKLGFEEAEETGGQVIKILNGEPTKRRIRRHLSLIAGVKHEEEFLIPNVPLNFKGSIELVEMQRIKNTDLFRILPTKEGNGIITIHNKKTGQIYVEMRLDIRKQDVDKYLREVKALLADIEGIEYKIVNNKILLDGYVLLPKDLSRIGFVMKQFPADTVKSLMTLSPLARKKIVEYISRDINNPEVVVTAVGDFIKLEGAVNSEEEKTRIASLVKLYMPDFVNELQPGLENVTLVGRDKRGDPENFIINLITVRKDENKVEPPPKMIQVVVHFVEFSDRYLKNFQFNFSPSLKSVGQAGRAPTTLGETIDVISNLLPKLQWARNHGFVRILDTASVLTQDKKPGAIQRSVNINNGQVTTGAAAGGAQGGQAPAQAPSSSTQLGVNVTPTIKQERGGLVELALQVTTSPAGGATISPTTSINTTISVRDRQSAAFGGIINKKSGNDYGGPASSEDAIVTFKHGKKYEKSNTNFVVFVTPIIKSSASAGVEQVKKKFRMKIDE